MPRVKDIKQPLQSLPFLPVIQGKGDKAESCGTIVPHRPCEGQKGYAHTGPNQRMLLTEYIEQEHSDDRKDRVIRTKQQ